MKVLNLYAGIGGNRKLWEDVEVTAVELDPAIAKIYQDYFPDDKVIVADAHQYLLDHYKEFDFIWSSPPCVTHTRINKNFGRVRYADMNLYQEIILLKTWFGGKYCFENVIPYYQPLMPAQQNNRHLFWCNFRIVQTNGGNPPKQIPIETQNTMKKRKIVSYKEPLPDIINGVNERFGFNLKSLDNKGAIRTGLRNAVDPKTGLMILNCARNIITKHNEKQIDLEFNQEPKP